MDVSKYLAESQRLAMALKQLGTAKKPLGDLELAESLEKAVVAANALNVSDLSEMLTREVAAVRKRIDSHLEHRRETLLKAARDAGVSQKRFGEYDRVGLFKVGYKGRKVTLEIGSEPMTSLEETNGEEVFAAIQKATSSLESAQFSREEFFRTVKSALRLAQERGEDRDGWVPVKTAYAYVALLRNLQSAEFARKPTQRGFQDYSTAQFVYDLARFGSRGWACGEDVLHGESPNMATVSAGKAMTLPELSEMDKLGPQMARVRIEKGAASGTQRDSGKAR